MVYFHLVNAEREPFIKTGFTRNHRKRDKDHHQSKLGVKISVKDLCKVRGTRADESAVQRYFAKHAVKGETEVFLPHDDLVDYIRWLRDQYFVWVPDDEHCDEIEYHDAVESDLWLPNQDRRKERPPENDLFVDPDFGPLFLPPRKLTIDDFYTDPSILDAARLAMGGIDLDPASHPVANRAVKARRFFNIYDNGLVKQWAGRVWLNPPFSEWKSWVPKIVTEWKSGRIQSMCVLCATRTLTAQYFSDIHRHCKAVCIFEGRIAFWGGLAASPDDGHAVFYFGDDLAGFAGAFRRLGHVFFSERV